MIEYYPYFRSLEQLETQFEFLRYAMLGLSEKRANEYFLAKGKQELIGYESLRQITADSFDAQAALKLMDCTKRRIKTKWGSEKRLLYRKQFIPDDLNKSELLLLVALFEGFLKDIYSMLVVAEPRRAFALSGKTVLLKEIFGDNCNEWRKGKFFQKILEDEVSRFDRLSFRDKMVFLKKSYNIAVDSKQIAVADELIERRHKISHCWTDRNEIKHVSLKVLEEARRVFGAIPWLLVNQASAKDRYPNYFQS